MPSKLLKVILIIVILGVLLPSNYVYGQTNSSQEVVPEREASLSIATLPYYDTTMSPEDASYERISFERFVYILPNIGSINEAFNIINDEVHNNYHESLDSITFVSTYEPIEWETYAHDTHGNYLDIDIVPSENSYLVTVHLAETVAPGETYKYTLYLETRGMAKALGNDMYEVNISTDIGTPVQEHTESLALYKFAEFDTFEPAVSRYESDTVTIRGVWELGNEPTFNATAKFHLPWLLWGFIYSQNEPPWGTTQYDHLPGVTMDEAGCFTTSATMVFQTAALEDDYLNANSAYMQLLEVTDPGDHNAWLINNGGYRQSDGAYYPSSIIRYARSIAETTGYRVDIDHLYRIDGQSPETDALIEQTLRDGYPVILQVRWPSTGDSHFVVAAGIVEIEGEKTFFIWDPEYDNVPGVDDWEETLLYYGNHYDVAHIYGSAGPTDESMTISVDTAAELIITDPLGRRLGYDPTTDQTYNEIPIAGYGSYSFMESTTMGADIAFPIDGTYTIQVIGTESGMYTVETSTTDWQGVLTTQTFSGETTPNEVDVIELPYETGLAGRIFLPIVVR